MAHKTALFNSTVSVMKIVENMVEREGRYLLNGTNEECFNMFLSLSGLHEIKRWLMFILA